MSIRWTVDSTKFTYKTIYKLNTLFVDLEILWDDRANVITDGSIVVRSVVFKKINDPEFCKLPLNEAKMVLIQKTLEEADYITIGHFDLGEFTGDEIQESFAKLSDAWIVQKLQNQTSEAVLVQFERSEQQSKCLAKFESAHGFVVPQGFSIPDEKTTKLRKLLLEEEFEEASRAFKAKDRIACCHEINDFKYVCYGTLLSYGCELDQIRYCHCFLRFHGLTKQLSLSKEEWSLCSQWLSAARLYMLDLFDEMNKKQGSDKTCFTAKITTIVACCDYLMMGAHWPHNECFDEIHKSNLTKFVDGVALRDEYGKVLKPHSYKAPNLQQFFAKE